MNPLAQWLTWEGAPCQDHTRLVELASLSSKSDSTFVDDRVQGTLLASVISVSSLQYPADWEAPGQF